MEKQIQALPSPPVSTCRQSMGSQGCQTRPGEAWGLPPSRKVTGSPAGQ